MTAAIGQLHFTITTTLGQVFASELTIVDQQPFSNPANSGTETLVLWHLDETNNGTFHFNGSGDPVPAVIGGTPGSLSTAGDGRFGKGREKANIVADNANNPTYLGTSSFTIECWVKGGPAVTRAYTLVGREDLFGGSNFTPEYSLRITPAGGLRGFAFDTSFRFWKAEMPGHVYDHVTNGYLPTLNDGLWHYVAMVADRTAGQLTLYVDGVARASAAMPAGFAAITSSSQPLRAGHWAFSEDNALGGPEEFPGTIDEVRLQNVARTAAQIADTWLGTNSGGSAMAPTTQDHIASSIAGAPTAPALTPDLQPQLRVTSAAPNLVVRDKSITQPRVTNLTVSGVELSGAHVQVKRDGKVLRTVVAKVLDSNQATAKLALSVDQNTPLGLAQLVLSRPGYAEAAVDIRIVEPSEFALEPDTVGLWHLEEKDDGATRLIDASDRAIALVAAQSSKPVAGRFGSVI